MKTTVIALLATAATTAVSAQATSTSSAATSSTTQCAADYIVEACLSSEEAKRASCGTTDYDCQCAAYEAILTCFNNCPNDPRISSEAGQKDIYCSYKSQFASSTTVSAASASASASEAAATTTGAGGTAASASASSSTTGTPNSAAELAFSAGGVLAVVAGAVMALL